MRSLLIPVCLIALGVLAALPFRRVRDRAADDVRATDAADPFSASITPIGEAPLVTADTPRERPIVPLHLASVPQPPSNPRLPWLENRAESYQEVAIPLALPEDEGNIFNSGKASAQTLERFGIPEGLLAGQTGAAVHRELAETRLWDVEQPIPALEPASALASVLEKEPVPSTVGVIPAASKSPAAKIVEPTSEEPAPAPRKRMFIREPGR